MHVRAGAHRYALAWLALDVAEGLDINPKLYRTGAYRLAPPKTRRLYRMAVLGRGR